MSFFLEGPAGGLEARYWRAAGGAEPRAAAAVCHPHPLHGGSMHSSVVFRVGRALQETGVAVLRFNFRGVGRSGGEHEGAGGEEEDLRAALDWLAAEHPDVEIWAGGFSFGARTAAGLATRDPRVARVVLVALPVLVYDLAVIERLRVPGLICQAGADDFGDLAALRRLHPGLDPRLELREVPGADHFFRGHVAELQDIVRSAAARWTG